MTTPFAPENSGCIFEFAEPEDLIIHAKGFLSILYHIIPNWKLLNFAVILPEFGCRGNAICSLKNSDSIFESFNPETLSYTRKNCLHILYRTEICAILAYFV